MSESADGGPYPEAGDRIDLLRMARGWSVTELARTAGLSRETVHLALKGELSHRTASRIARAFGVPLFDVLGTESLEEATNGAPAVQEAPPRPYHAGGHDVAFVAQAAAILAEMAADGDTSLPPAARLAVLDGIEQAARISGRRLPEAYWLLRRALADAVAGSPAGPTPAIPGTVTGLPDHTPTHRGTPAGGTRAARGGR